MFPQKSRIPKVDSKTYPLGEKSEHPDYPYALALVALSHSPGEHRLYSAMLSTPTENLNGDSFTARQLMTLTGIRSLSTIRRGLDGLLTKLSIERGGKENGSAKRGTASVYRVHKPDEIIARRHEMGELGLGIYGKGTDRRKRNRDATHELHGVPPSLTAPPYWGTGTQLWADPHPGDKPPHWSTSFGLDRAPIRLTFEGPNQAS